MFRLLRHITPFVVTVALILVLASTLGMFHFGMEMEGGMSMSFCPLMSGQAIVCTMSPLEHIAAWQSMFVTIVQQNDAELITLLLAWLAAALVWAPFFRRKPTGDPLPTFSSTRRSEVTLPLPLWQELFSSGILNPKLF